MPSSKLYLLTYQIILKRLLIICNFILYIEKSFKSRSLITEVEWNIEKNYNISNIKIVFNLEKVKRIGEIWHFSKLIC